LTLLAGSSARELGHGQRNPISTRSHTNRRTSFGEHLLPGMYSAPLGVVPKPNSTKFRLINDHSAGPFSQNSMIPKDAGHIVTDGMRPLGQAILELRQKHPEEEPAVLNGKRTRSSLSRARDMSIVLYASVPGLHLVYGAPSSRSSCG